MKEICDNLVHRAALQIMDILKPYFRENQAEAMNFVEKKVLYEGKTYLPDYLDLSENVRAFLIWNNCAELNGERTYCGELEEDGRPLRFLLLQRIQSMLEERLPNLPAEPFLAQENQNSDQAKETDWLLEAYAALLLEHQKYDTDSRQELTQKKTENTKRYQEIYSRYMDGQLSEPSEKADMLCEMGTLMREYYELCSRDYVTLCRTAFAAYHVIYFLAVLRLCVHGSVRGEALSDRFADTSVLFHAIRQSGNLCSYLQRILHTVTDDAKDRAANLSRFPEFAVEYLEILAKGSI